MTILPTSDGNSQENPMDPSMIVVALISGATVAMKDTAAQAVKDAYAGLKYLLINKFSIGSIPTLEKDPLDDIFQKSVEKEISLSPGILEDSDVKALIVKLYSEIERNASGDNLKSVGVDIEEIRSQRDTIIRGISGFNVGVKSKIIESGENTVIENIRVKPEA